MTELSWTAVWHALVFGAICAACYDPVSSARRVFSLPVWAVSVLDLCYFFLLASASYCFFLLESFGEVRIALVFCGAVGALVWYQTFGRLLRLLCRMVFCIVRALFSPVIWIFSKLLQPLQKFAKIPSKARKKLQRNVENLLAKHRTGSV